MRRFGDDEALGGGWVHRGKDHRVTIELADERLNAP